MPFSIVVDLAPKVAPVVNNGLPHPATGRVSSPALLLAAPPYPPAAAPVPAVAAAAAAVVAVVAPAAPAGRLGRMAGAAVLASAA